MIRGGLRIFGVKSRNMQKPEIKTRAAKAFAKYHEFRERVLERMENPKTKMGMLVGMMLARFPKNKQDSAAETKESLEKLGERIDGKREMHLPVGINQDACGWYAECGRPRYPMS